MEISQNGGQQAAVIINRSLFSSFGKTFTDFKRQTIFHTVCALKAFVHFLVTKLAVSDLSDKGLLPVKDASRQCYEELEVWPVREKSFCLSPT